LELIVVSGISHRKQRNRTIFKFYTDSGTRIFPQGKNTRKRLKRIEKSPLCETCEGEVTLENSCLYRLGVSGQENRPVKLLCISCYRRLPEHIPDEEGKNNRLYRIRKSWHEQRPYCFYCENKLELADSTLDHRVPRSQGGGNTKNNLVLSCYECNYAKAEYSEEVFRRHILPNLLLAQSASYPICFEAG
jgi:hypothetical protein